MLLRALRQKVPGRSGRGYFARAILPVHIQYADAQRAFGQPLGLQLAALEIGHVADLAVSLNQNGEAEHVVITFSLTSDHPRMLETIAGLLEELDAPRGSVIGTAETPEQLPFGRTEGLGLYLDPGDGTGEDDHLDVLEACTDALEGAGIYQGHTRLGERTALYFYGDSFNEMKNALTFVVSTEPRCRNAYARRLTRPAMAD